MTNQEILDILYSQRLTRERVSKALELARNEGQLEQVRANFSTLSETLESLKGANSQ